MERYDFYLQCRESGELRFICVVNGKNIDHIMGSLRNEFEQRMLQGCAIVLTTCGVTPIAAEDNTLYLESEPLWGDHFYLDLPELTDEDIDDGLVEDEWWGEWWRDDEFTADEDGE